MFIGNDAPDTPSALLWRAMEKGVLILFTLYAVISVLWDGLTLSDRVFHGKEKVYGLKESPWNTDWKLDANDGQLRSFRSNLPLLTFGAIAFITGKRLFMSEKTYQPQLKFYAVSGLVICTYIHGLGILYLVAWMLANYALAKVFRGWRWFSATVWIGNLGLLVVTEYFDGYGFAWMGLKDIERYYHPEMQWHRSSNLCFLKLISYLLDSHWSAQHQPTVPKEVPIP